MQGILMLELLLARTIQGAKTMTRRSGSLDNLIKLNPDEWEFWRLFDGHAKFVQKNNATNEQYFKARYSIGETVFIKEPWRQSQLGGIDYLYLEESPAIGRYKNKMFMPESAARHFIKITDISVERLFDISDEDCKAEGIEPDGTRWKDYMTKERFKSAATPKDSFFSLYRKANSYRPSKKIENIWVFVYTYELLK